ncbi:MAG TPA: threonine aldolase family protein [Actinomycetota bacterium]|nr:threonine aldolase family protein [Actinomycetota bacterium]
MSRFRVDLRSDTVTAPSPEMRRAMAEAEVGDAWYGDDPTVNRLQELAAECLGTEAALYVPTGTMANQIALALHTNPGHLAACSEWSHVATTEVMTSATLSGIAFRTADPGPRGWIDAEIAAALLEPDSYYDVEVVDVVSVENTVGGAGGRVMPAEELRAVRKVAEAAGVGVHLDGARLFNAAAAAGVDAVEFAREADTVMFCVSKGLGAPIGSLLCGPAELMPEARRLWILFGGAWRQAGITAAAGIVALERGPGRLHEDHERARRLAEGVAERLPGSIDLGQVETNMVFVDTEAVGLGVLETLERLEALGVGATHTGSHVRMVTHVDVSDDGVDVALEAWASVAEAASPGRREGAKEE